MGKLQDIVAKAIANVKPEMEAAVAKSVGTTAPKASGKIGGMKAPVGSEQERVAELGMIAKSLRGGQLSSADLQDLNIRAKAVGVTGDVAELLPDGFTGTLLRDIQAELNVARLFPMRTIAGGVAHDTIALYGITAYLTGEATTGTDSNENYQTFVATTKKVLALVRKSYELLDDSLIDIAAEVRSGIVRAVAEAVELAVINGDIAGTQDGTTYGSNSAALACNGIRKHGLNKSTIDASVIDWTVADGGEAQFLDVVTKMQDAGSLYLDRNEVMKGNVALMVDQSTYGHIRAFNSYKTKEKAGNVATLFGGAIDTIFDVPLVVTSGMPYKVDANGVVDSAAPNNNMYTAMYMFNIDTLRLSANGTVIAESDKDITDQTFIYTGSLRFGFSSIFDSTEAAINTINPNFKNVVAAIALAK
jgi:HK97 family phage major capsid protein